MIDVNKYIRLKAKGRITLSKVGGSFAASSNAYDSETGDVKETITESVDLQDVVQLKAVLLQRAQYVQQLIDDLRAL